VSFTRLLPPADLAGILALAARLAELAQRADIFALCGPLGSGKTTLARAFVQSLCGAATEVPSPSFTLLQSYDSPKGPLFHFDLFRLTGAEQTAELGLDDAFADGISLVEWPDRLGSLLPRRRLRLSLAAGPTPDSRTVTLDGDDVWRQRWQ
jgi:tRNA threonylcarbamoyladenosine biosynthesis protein TsaE